MPIHQNIEKWNILPLTGIYVWLLSLSFFSDLLWWFNENSITENLTVLKLFGECSPPLIPCSPPSLVKLAIKKIWETKTFFILYLTLNMLQERSSLTPWWISFFDFNLCFQLLLLLCWYCPVAKSCPTLCNPMDCSIPHSFVLHSIRIYSNSCPLSWSWYLTISSSATLFSCLQSFLASGSSSVSQLFQ